MYSFLFFKVGTFSSLTKIQRLQFHLTVIIEYNSNFLSFLSKNELLFLLGFAVKTPTKDSTAFSRFRSKRFLSLSFLPQSFIFTINYPSSSPQSNEIFTSENLLRGLVFVALLFASRNMAVIYQPNQTKP